ncbi:MAG: alginate export family protein [Phycisphaerales bacterium]|nr:alginate export family protein [Phycisphaerales bacterium]
MSTSAACFPPRPWGRVAWCIFCLIFCLALEAAQGQSSQPSTAPHPEGCDRRELVDGPPPAAPLKDWVDQIKNPLPGFTWGADLRLREVYINNAINLDKHNPDHEIHWQRQRARWWTTIAPVEDVEFNMRIAWEGKHFDKPKSFENWQPTSTVFDLLNLKLSRIGGSPFTIQAGRQELMLGDRWLVMDGTPLDGSSTLYFDAIRLIGDFESIDTRFELIYLENDAEQKNWFRPLCDRDLYVVEQDETGVIAWLTNTSLPRTQLDAYYIYKKGTQATPRGYDAEIHTFGFMGEHGFADRWKFRGNLAGQFGRKNDATLCALGSLNRLSYELKDAWNSRLRLDYEYLSGDDPDTETNEAFDILWGRWPRFSEMYIYNNIGEGGRIGDMTNLHRIGFGWTGNPSKKMELCADYHLLFADQNTYAGTSGFSNSGCFRGQLLTALMKYQFNRFLSGHLVSEFFFPGDYYSNERNDPACFLRAEIMITW